MLWGKNKKVKNLLPDTYLNTDSNSDLDLEEIINKFSVVSIDKGKPRKQIEIADPVNYSLLILYIDTIPNYEGKPQSLGIFLDNYCENLII